MTIVAFFSIVFGFVALIGLVFIVLALFRQHKYEAIRGTRRVAIAGLAAMPPGDGGTCAITGFAEPGPAGPLVAPMSGRPCVWFHAKIVEHWTTTVTTIAPGPNGTTIPTTQTNHHRRLLHENGSPPQFAVRDQTGIAVLDFLGTRVDRPFPSFRNRVRALPGPVPGLPVVIIGRRQNHHITYEEDIVGYGQPIFARGKGGPHPGTGVPALIRPDSGPFIVTTRAPEQYTKSIRTPMIVFYVIGGVLTVAGGSLTTLLLLAGSP